MSISTLSETVRQGLVEFAWAQWAQWGVSGYPTRSDRWALDPEALVLFTIEVARRDPRLFDEVLDWLCLNGRKLSIQRLRNLVPRFPVDRDLVEAVVAWVGEAAPGVQWRPSGGGGGEHVRPSERLFSPDVVSFVPEHDPVFARHGYLRPPTRRSEKSTEPDLRLPVSLALQLRHLFGPGARSEVMRILLTCPEGPLDAARIADEAAFSKRNVSETLSALVAARVVKARWSGNERLYLTYRDKWAVLLVVGPSAEHLPAFVPWVRLLPLLVEVLLWLEREAATGDSDYLVSSRARDLVERITPDLEALGLEASAGRSLAGASYLPTFEETMASLLHIIGRRR